MNHDSQRLKIQRHLVAGKTITPAEAYERFGCLALSQRIGEIRRNIPVKSEIIKVGRSRVARYSVRR